MSRNGGETEKEVTKMTLKTINELKNGACVVVTEHGNFEGHFKSEYPAVFFTIPAHYKILGYIQD